ncbi:MAG TPA: hypothetical protein DCO77_07765, partial [Nitrospiraceae bacterium]|nr:hypothetical protein [Nitrospiraceae bacterium]
MKILIAIAMLLPTIAFADITIPDTAPPLPPKADFPPGVAEDVASKGYHVSEIRNDIFWITNGDYHVMAVKTHSGVMIVDAPEPLPFFPPMDVLGAVAEIAPGYPITHMIYSHGHTDHIGGAGVIKESFPDVQIIAHKRTKGLLAKIKDPKRPVPTITFVNTMTVSSGGKQLKLHYRGNTHMPGNIFVHAHNERILMVVDVIFPGWVPFRRLALSDNINGWIEGNKAVLDFDFDTLIAGHVTRLGTRGDVELQLEYVQDIIDSFDSIMGDPNTLFNAIDAYDSVHGPGAAFATSAKWALFSAFYDAATMACSDLLD